MCLSVHDIYLCGHDGTKHLQTCETYRRSERRRWGRSRRIPNHETTFVDRRPHSVCDRCWQEGRPANPVYIRAARDEARDEVRDEEAREEVRAPSPPRTPSPRQDGQRPPQRQPEPPLRKPVDENDLPNNLPQPQRRPPRPQPPEFPPWLRGAQPQAGRMPNWGLEMGVLPRVWAPNGFMYIVTPQGLALLSPCFPTFWGVLY